MTGFRGSMPSSQSGEARAGSRADIAFRLPQRVLISPLWPSNRNGCASAQLELVLVEYRWWKTAIADSKSGDTKSGKKAGSWVPVSRALYTTVRHESEHAKKPSSSGPAAAIRCSTIRRGGKRDPPPPPPPPPPPAPGPATPACPPGG